MEWKILFDILIKKNLLEDAISKVESKTDFKSDREEKILQKIQKSGPVTIKDIAQEFADISEKTIQRELQKMVDRGQIKKEGERRWTKYFI